MLRPYATPAFAPLRAGEASFRGAGIRRFCWAQRPCSARFSLERACLPRFSTRRRPSMSLQPAPLRTCASLCPCGPWALGAHRSCGWHAQEGRAQASSYVGPVGKRYGQRRPSPSRAALSLRACRPEAHPWEERPASMPGLKIAGSHVETRKRTPRETAGIPPSVSLGERSRSKRDKSIPGFGSCGWPAWGEPAFM